jgi:hypothetical protein
MTEAIFGLVGVLVGGLITWGAEAWRDRQRLAGEARVAARMVTMELLGASTRFEGWEMRPETMPAGDSEHPLAEMSMWTRHRGTLARTLDADSWWRVNTAFVVVEGPRPNPDWRLLLNQGLRALAGPAGLKTDPIPDTPLR